MLYFLFTVNFGICNLFIREQNRGKTEQTTNYINCFSKSIWHWQIFVASWKDNSLNDTLILYQIKKKTGKQISMWILFWIFFLLFHWQQFFKAILNAKSRNRLDDTIETCLCWFTLLGKLSIQTDRCQWKNYKELYFLTWYFQGWNSSKYCKCKCWSPSMEWKQKKC